MNKKPNPIVFMFSGQGSQYYQMGRDLYDTNPVFRQWLDKLDAIVKKLAGYSVIESLYAQDASKSVPMKDIELSHPAIVMVEYALAKTLMSAGLKPDYLLGVSLGEFTAAAIAKAIDIESLLALVLHQANNLDFSESTGSMIAVLNDGKSLPALLAKFDCELAGKNYSSHYLVAGSNTNINLLQDHLKQNAISSHLLPVDYAFHSSLLDKVKDQVLPFILQQSYKKPELALISSAEARIMDELQPEHFWKVIRNPIQFSRTIEQLEETGNYQYIDLGPSSTLANFVKYNLAKDSTSTCEPILDPFGDNLERFAKALTLLKSEAAIPAAAHNTLNKDFNSMKAFIFPGQGSQFKGMGKELFKQFPSLIKEADAILGYSIENLCLDDPKKQLSLTQFTQPALYVVSALAFLAEAQSGSKADVVAGHSLGEYAALFAAGVFDFATGLKLVKRRGELMGQIKVEGGMAAILNTDETTIRSILEKARLTGIDVANFNTPKQTVIAGQKKDLIAAEKAFQRAQATFVPLNVSAPFHSRYMETAAAEFAQFLQQFTFSEPKIPVIANVSARPYQASAIKDLLARQISSSVKWTETVNYLLGQGVNDYKELGPGEVLTKMVGTIKSMSTPLTVPDSEALVHFIPVAAPPTAPAMVSAPALGSRDFSRRFGCQYSYVLGSIGRAISSADLVVKAANAGFLTYFGAAHTSIENIQHAINDIQSNIGANKSYGVNLHANLLNPDAEDALVDLLLENKIKHAEATGFFDITPALVRYRLQGIEQGSTNSILAKAESITQAIKFLQPAPDAILTQLLNDGSITTAQAQLARSLPMADAIAFQGDIALLAELLSLRNQYGVPAQQVFIGSAKEIGSPQSIASAFINGAEFVLADTIQQCTVESGLHNQAKTLLQNASIADIKTAPCTELFEFGRTISVLNKGSLFANKAKRLYELWKDHKTLENLSTEQHVALAEYFPEGIEYAIERSSSTRQLLNSTQTNVASSDSARVWTQLVKYYLQAATNQNDTRPDWCITCGPDIGTLNNWLNKEKLVPWQERHIDQLALQLLSAAHNLLNPSVTH